MKSVLFYASIVMISGILGGVLYKQVSGRNSLIHELNPEETKIYLGIKEKCKTADQKGMVFLKKYGDQSSNGATSSSEWNEAQSWEQACSDSFEHLRDYFRNKP